MLWELAAPMQTISPQIIPFYQTKCDVGSKEEIRNRPFLSDPTLLAQSSAIVW